MRINYYNLVCDKNDCGGTQQFNGSLVAASGAVLCGHNGSEENVLFSCTF